MKGIYPHFNGGILAVWATPMCNARELGWTDAWKTVDKHFPCMPMSATACHDKMFYCCCLMERVSGCESWIGGAVGLGNQGWALSIGHSLPWAAIVLAAGRDLSPWPWCNWMWPMWRAVGTGPDVRRQQTIHLVATTSSSCTASSALYTWWCLKWMMNESIWMPLCFIAEGSVR